MPRQWWALLGWSFIFEGDTWPAFALALLIIYCYYEALLLWAYYCVPRNDSYVVVTPFIYVSRLFLDMHVHTGVPKVCQAIFPIGFWIADIVINAMYKHTARDNSVSGPRLRDLPALSISRQSPRFPVCKLNSECTPLPAVLPFTT